ncbi:unnamed protein product, partial [marine sediment metagenome]
NRYLSLEANYAPSRVRAYQDTLFNWHEYLLSQAQAYEKKERLQ